jgi:hypothetical protein
MYTSTFSLTVEVGVWHQSGVGGLKSLKTGTNVAIFSSLGTKPLQVYEILQGFHYQSCNLFEEI